MTDEPKVIGIRGAVPTPPPEGDGLMMAAQQVLCRAVADGTTGLLVIWHTASGEVAYEAVRCRGVLLRGMIEETRDLYLGMADD